MNNRTNKLLRVHLLWSNPNENGNIIVYLTDLIFNLLKKDSVDSTRVLIPVAFKNNIRKKGFFTESPVLGHVYQWSENRDSVQVASAAEPCLRVIGASTDYTETIALLLKLEGAVGDEIVTGIKKNANIEFYADIDLEELEPEKLQDYVANGVISEAVTKVLLLKSINDIVVIFPPAVTQAA